MNTPTPAQGPIDHPSPRANTLAEIQETWAKAKNYPVAIANKKDALQ